MSMEVRDPPSPPPLPPPRREQKPSAFALKVKHAPPGWAFQGKVVHPARDHLTAPPGLYFLYGTLRDPALLADILDLPSPPVLRPAYIIGYETKLWGTYPALVDKPGAIVRGSAFLVPDATAAEKLASYETNSYRADPCTVRLSDGTEAEATQDGFTFKFCGNPNDLEDGEFDLDIWLKRMGRHPIPSS